MPRSTRPPPPEHDSISIFGCFFAEVREDRINVANEFDVDLFLFVRGNGVPAGLGPVAVVVPLQEGDVVFREKFVEEVEDVIADVGTREVEDELIARFGAWAAGKIQRPVGMLAIEIGIGIHHFGLDPEAEIHFQLVDFVDQRFQTVGEFFFVDVPIAEAGVIGFALAEPAVVHDEAIDAETRRFFGECDLAGNIDVHFCGFPGVVDHGARFGIGRLGKNVLELVFMQDARGAAETVIGVAAVENRRFEFFTGLEFVGEIEWVKAACDAYRFELRFFDGEAP